MKEGPAYLLGRWTEVIIYPLVDRKEGPTYLLGRGRGGLVSGGWYIQVRCWLPGAEDRQGLPLTSTCNT